MDELTLAQERLGRTLERARASEDRELAGRVRDEGYQLVHQLNGLLRMSRLHSLDNHAFDKPLRDSARGLECLAELLGTLTLAVVEDQVYLNEIRIRLDEPKGGAPELGTELARHGLGGMRFHRAPPEPDLRRFVACFAAKPDPTAPRAALRAALEREGLEGLELLGRFHTRMSGDQREPTSGPSLQDTLRRCAQAVTDAFDTLGRGRLFNPLPARRAVNELLEAGDAGLGPAANLEGFAPHVAHALRVCRLSVLLGREVGLGPGLLQDLGVAALLHDVGYAEADPGHSRPRPDLVRHPSAGARLLLRQRGFHLSKVRRIGAVLSHHAPAGGRRRQPPLLARLLRVAEDYDILVERSGLVPARALSSLMAEAGTAYDPLLLQAFVNALARRGVVVAGGAAADPEVPELVLVEPSLLSAPPPMPRPAPLPSPVPARVPAPPPAAVPATAPANVSADVAPVPALDREGTLSQGLPIRLIHDAHLERRNGRLSFESATETCALHFVSGSVVATWSSRPEHSLEAVLLSGGAITPAQLVAAQAEAARTGHPIGRTLHDRALLDTDILERALCAQARVLVSALVEWDEGRYRFLPDDGPQPEEDEGHLISTDGLIVDAVRALHDPDVVRFALGNLDRPLRRSADPARRPAQDLLGPAEERLLQRVDGGTTARQLLKGAGLSTPEAQRSLLMLLALGLAEYPPS